MGSVISQKESAARRRQSHASAEAALEKRSARSAVASGVAVEKLARASLCLELIIATSLEDAMSP
jgi:hypothetical protein